MGPVKQRCIRCQQDEGIAALLERTSRSEEGGIDGSIKWRRSAGGDGDSASASGCQIPAGMLTCQLSRLGCPAGTIMGLRVLAVLPLTDCCNAIMDVQMWL